MLTISNAAQQKLITHLEAKEDRNLAVRLSIIGRGQEGFQYDFRMVLSSDHNPADTAIQLGEYTLLIDPETWQNVDGAQLDLKEDGRGFKIDNPNPVWRDAKGPAILEVIDTRINPGIALHGGHVRLIDVRDDVVYIAFGGGCQGCGLVNVTLKEGVHKMIHEAVPDIREVVDLTEHALGANPFYRPNTANGSSS